jgi:RNA:NAD 2'-phosphotransferase (TPT1/KptA family)
LFERCTYCRAIDSSLFYRIASSTLSEAPLEVGRRKHPQPVLLRVDAAEAAKHGVQFYVGNDKVWLADKVPAAYIVVDG